MFDSESTLKDGAADLGTNLSGGGLPHKREFARVVTAWKTAKVMAETKIQTDVVARAHGVPVTLLLANRTAMIPNLSANSGLIYQTIVYLSSPVMKISPSGW